MKERLITAVFGFAILIPILLFSDTIVLPIAVALFSALGVWEMLGCIGMRNNPVLTGVSMLMAAAAPFLTHYMEISGEKLIALFAIISFIYLFMVLCIAVITKKSDKIGDYALAFLTTLYIVTGFTCIQTLRDCENGAYLFALLFTGAWVTDGAAYFVGRALGKHKLTEISPKKTVEGAVGGLIFCAVSFEVIGVIIKFGAGVEPNWLLLAVIGLGISIISQFGDLICSLIKRHYGIKDYGKLFPGHGGVMDRFDSIIAISPFLQILCMTGAFVAF